MVAFPTTAIAGGSSQGAWKAEHGNDPHTTISNRPHHQGMPVSHKGSAAPLTVPSDALIGENQQGQQNSYYCGPAAEAEAVGLIGPSYSQSSEAWYLKTTTGGTAWSGGNANVPSNFQSGYPMRDVLDYQYFVYSGGINPAYAVVGLPDTPSQTDINNYISHMTSDISYFWPLLG